MISDRGVSHARLVRGTLLGTSTIIQCHPRLLAQWRSPLIWAATAAAAAPLARSSTDYSPADIPMHAPK